VQDLEILNLFTPLPIHFQLNLNANTERINLLNNFIKFYQATVLLINIRTIVRFCMHTDHPAHNGGGYASLRQNTSDINW